MKKKSTSAADKLKKTPSGPRKRDRADTERRLREAAVTVFSKHGYDAATTKLVAQTAGINEALINRYFNGKNGLLLAILEAYVREEHSKRLEYEPCETLAEEIRQYFRTKAEETSKSDRGDMMRIVISRVAVDVDLRQYIVKELSIRGGDPRLAERVERLKALGRIPKHVDAQQVSKSVGDQVFANLIYGHLIFRMDLRDVTTQLEHFIETYVRGLLTPPLHDVRSGSSR